MPKQPRKFTVLRAYEVAFEGAACVVNHVSLAKAKYDFALDLSDHLSVGETFKRIRARSLGPARDDHHAARMREYRNRPDLKTGVEVLCAGRRGWIAGACRGGGAWFRVVFEDGSSCGSHPCDIALADAA